MQAFSSELRKRPLKYNSVDEKRLLNFWDKGDFSKLLKNVKAKKPKTRDGHLISIPVLRAKLIAPEVKPEVETRMRVRDRLSFPYTFRL